MEKTVKKIRTDLRLSMNGIIATSMRQKGMDYKMNFGVDVPKLRLIARNYTPNATLADMLWREEAREMKILATLLYPIDKFSEEEALQWIDSIPNQEIREQLCINLLQKVAFADKLVSALLTSHDAERRIAGYWLYVRLSILRSPLLPHIQPRLVMEQATKDVSVESYYLRAAALNALKFLGRNATDLAKEILEEIRHFSTSSDMAEKEIYDSLQFEFGL